MTGLTTHGQFGRATYSRENERLFLSIGLVCEL